MSPPARIRSALAGALFVASTNASADCVVRSESARIHVRVTPDGEPAFPLDLADQSFLVAPGRSRAARVFVKSPVAFAAEARDLEYWVTLPVDAAGGRLRLRAWSKLVRAVARGDEAEGTVRLGIGVSIPRVRVACEALSIDEPSRGTEGDPAPTPVSDERFWAREDRIFLADAPRSRGGVIVHGRAPELVLEDLGRSGAWRHVVFRDGTSSVEGWTPASRLRRARDETFGIGLGGMGDGCGVGMDGGPGVFDGPARVAKGTVVFARPGRGPWGVVATDAALRVRHAPGAPYARIVTAPGLAERCFALDHAWVAAESVTLPVTPVSTGG